jgi:hypothetical protein
MSPCPTLQEKRRLDSPIDDEVYVQPQSPRSQTSTRSVSNSPGGHDTDKGKAWGPLWDASTVERHRSRRLGTPTPADREQTPLTKEQRELLQQWYEGFGRPLVAPTLPDEHIVAFATAIRIKPEVVMDYVRRRRKSNGTTDHSVDAKQPGEDTMLCSVELMQPSSETYTLATANKHLPPTILPIVERYVSGCSRRRSQNDGRRSVNKGPYRCTFGCGYRTKRAFDWRRHEETHEPQELWLCKICGHNDTHNPFLVNRKDKFLKHVTDKHGSSAAAETVLDKSKLEFVPRATLGCLFCEVKSVNWDERCRHVLGHFEDEVERSMKRVKVIHEEQDREETAFAEDSGVASSVKSACSGTDNLIQE